MTPPPSRIGQLRHRERRDDEPRPVLDEEARASLVVVVASLRAATSGPVSQRITPRPLRQPAAPADTPDTCRGSAQDLQGHAANPPAGQDAGARFAASRTPRRPTPASLVGLPYVECKRRSSRSQLPNFDLWTTCSLTVPYSCTRINHATKLDARARYLHAAGSAPEPFGIGPDRRPSKFRRCRIVAACQRMPSRRGPVSYPSPNGAQLPDRDRERPGSDLGRGPGRSTLTV